MGEGVSELSSVLEQYWGCPPEVARAAAERARLSLHKQRATIIRGQDAVDGVFVLIDGHAHALSYAFDGGQVLVEEFQRGDLFGAISAFAGSPVGDSDDVIAYSVAATGRYPTPTFLALMEQHGCIALAVTRGLARRLSRSNQRVIQIASISAPGRVSAELLRRGRENGDWCIRPAPVIVEIALMVQTTRETASRAISQLEKRGIIMREAGALRIVAPHRLEEMIY